MPALIAANSRVNRAFNDEKPGIRSDQHRTHPAPRPGGAMPLAPEAQIDRCDVVNRTTADGLPEPSAGMVQQDTWLDTGVRGHPGVRGIGLIGVMVVHRVPGATATATTIQGAAPPGAMPEIPQ